MMKKRTISLFLVLFLFMGMLPAQALPSVPVVTEPVYLGSEAEYQTTFETMFDENGLRKVFVAFNSKDGVLYQKYGLVNKYGNFVAQPIYDEIQLHTAYDLAVLGRGSSILPQYFIGGYTQAVRDGKMGLLNTRGEEVIPCQYDYVGLPSEGMCRVLNRIGNTDNYYLGYWNLEQNREVVAPNKYITFAKDPMIGNYATSQRKPEGDYYAYNDFIEGYAMVFTSMKQVNLDDVYQATIIDKNGKDVLGKTYMVVRPAGESDDFSFSTYPQKGPYLSFQENLTIKDREYYAKNTSRTKSKDTFTGYATGLVSPEGVLIKPTYTQGIFVKGACSMLSDKLNLRF